MEIAPWGFFIYLVQLNPHHVMYNFDKQIVRNGTSCFKYDGRKDVFTNKDVLPLWVADMDFATPDFIMDRVKKRCEHPILGYTFRDEEYNNAIIWWYKTRHSWDLQSSWIEFCPGVVSGLNHAIRAYTKPDDMIIIQPPVYHPFYGTVECNGRQLVYNPLVVNNGVYEINFEGLDQLASQGAKMLILSSPHNPVGRVWSADELRKVGEICLKHNVLVVSDEIHSDLILGSNNHVSLAAISDNFAMNSVTFASSSKTFNIAGLTSGFVIIPNKKLRVLYQHELEASGAGNGNIFGIEALKAAFTVQGAQWLSELVAYIDRNIDFVEDFLKRNLPMVRFTRPQGTYLLWLDFNALGITDEQLNDLLQNSAEVGFNAGSGFGREGNCFVRVNVACPLSTVEEAMQRVANALEIR